MQNCTQSSSSLLCAGASRLEGASHVELHEQSIELGSVRLFFSGHSRYRYSFPSSIEFGTLSFVVVD